MRQRRKSLIACDLPLRRRLKIFVAASLIAPTYFTQAQADPVDAPDLIIEDKYCANYFQARKIGQEKNLKDRLLCNDQEYKMIEEYFENKEAKPHYEFTCKAGLFSKTETFQVYDNWKTSKGEALDHMSPWYFIPIETSEDKERTLVIHETKLSAAMVTKTRRFSNSKGYYWDEEKFYCQREHYPH
jgi:hypothetical protein